MHRALKISKFHAIHAAQCKHQSQRCGRPVTINKRCYLSQVFACLSCYGYSAWIQYHHAVNPYSILLHRLCSTVLATFSALLLTLAQKHSCHPYLLCSADSASTFQLESRRFGHTSAVERWEQHLSVKHALLWL